MDNEKLQKVVNEIGAVLQSNDLSGGEYLTVLHNLVAHVLSENEKKVEKLFLENIRRDVLRRRLARIRAQNAAQGGVEPMANGGVE